MRINFCQTLTNEGLKRGILCAKCNAIYGEKVRTLCAALKAASVQGRRAEGPAPGLQFGVATKDAASPSGENQENISREQHTCASKNLTPQEPPASPCVLQGVLGDSYEIAR